LIYFSWDNNRDHPPQFVFKYQSSFLTPCCGLEGQKSTQKLKSVKDLGNTFDLSSKWARTLPSLIYLSWDKIVEGGLYYYPMKNISRTAKFLPTWSLD
jgi:hypothetical protein